jgi:hypothetical protein
MTAKSFAYSCLGILALVAAWTMGARHARADFDPQGSHIAGFSFWSNLQTSPVVLRSDGTVWAYNHMDPAVDWYQPNDVGPLPIPMSEVAFFDWVFLASKDGRVWSKGAPDWQSLGQVPVPTVDVESSTWSGVKDGYRK